MNMITKPLNLEKMIGNNPLGNIMTKDVITIGPDDILDLVQQIFEKENIHHLPVVNDANEVIGIISKSDYLMLCHHLTLFRKEFLLRKNRQFFKSLIAEDVMTKEVATLRHDDDISKAASLFRENRFHAIPILDDQDKLVGIVSTYDLLKYAYQEAAIPA